MYTLSHSPAKDTLRSVHILRATAFRCFYLFTHLVLSFKKCSSLLASQNKAAAESAADDVILLRHRREGSAGTLLVTEAPDEKKK